MSFGSRFWKRITPSSAELAPTAIASPSTSSAFANSEPRIENCATTSSPALSEKITMKNSGRLPSVDCSTPVTAGPNFAPTDSVAIPIAHATPPSAAPESDEDRDRRRVGVVEDARRRTTTAKIAPR